MNVDGFFSEINLKYPKDTAVMGFCGALKVPVSDAYNVAQKIKASGQVVLVGVLCEERNSRFIIRYIYRFSGGQSLTPFLVSIDLDRESDTIPSVAELWPSAYFDELEIEELFGLKFNRKIDVNDFKILPDSWHGNPLRKGYQYPEVYGGVEHRRPPLRKEHIRP